MKISPVLTVGVALCGHAARGEVSHGFAANFGSGIRAGSIVKSVGTSGDVGGGSVDGFFELAGGTRAWLGPATLSANAGWAPSTGAGARTVTGGAGLRFDVRGAELYALAEGGVHQVAGVGGSFFSPSDTNVTLPCLAARILFTTAKDPGRSGHLGLVSYLLVDRRHQTLDVALTHTSIFDMGHAGRYQVGGHAIGVGLQAVFGE